MDSDTTHELHVSRHRYDDEWVVAVDLGMFDVPDDRVAVDIIDGTAIVITSLPDGPAEFELELPAATGTAHVNNGVLTITDD